MKKQLWLRRRLRLRRPPQHNDPIRNEKETETLKLTNDDKIKKRQPKRSELLACCVLQSTIATLTENNGYDDGDDDDDNVDV